MWGKLVVKEGRTNVHYDEWSGHANNSSGKFLSIFHIVPTLLKMIIISSSTSTNFLPVIVWGEKRHAWLDEMHIKARQTSSYFLDTLCTSHNPTDTCLLSSFCICYIITRMWKPHTVLSWWQRGRMLCTDFSVYLVISNVSVWGTLSYIISIFHKIWLIKVFRSFCQI